tara:strand:+ start:15875 stop:16288 length:414 start_codon:yes stop_codon:yes gene_type:complete
MKIISSILTLTLIALITIGCNNTKKELKTEPAAVEQTKVTQTSSAKIESSKVCYVNNKFMGIDQMPVLVDNKTYYGCCEGCVTKLQQNLDDVRYGVDPLTGERVDKAMAYIVLSPLGNNDVLYFESEKNYLAYTKKS